MIEKRFRYYEHKGADYILDNPNTELDFIEMLGDCLEAEEIVDLLNDLNNENEQLKQFKENVIEWVDSQMKFNVKKYIETEHDHFKCENIDLHNFKVEMGID